MNKKYKQREDLIEKKTKLKKNTSVLDVSAKNIADEPLFSNNEIYRLLFENVVDVIIILDTSLRIMRVSPSIEHILGYKPEELTGKKFTDINLVIPNDLERAILRARSVLSGEKVEPVIYGFYSKDGSMKTSETSMVALYKDNRIIGVSLVAKEIVNRNIFHDESKYTMNKLRKALGGVIQAMAFTIESRDPCTAGHQRQVSNLARAIAIEMGISRDQTDGIRIVGSIHDIGKLSIPAEILSRPGRISEIEFNLIREHPRVGYEILKTIDFPWPVAETVLQHHERIDGSGYPQGLSGKDILIESKIIAVADVVEAMSSHRPHRASLGIEKALKEISQNSGILYDPRVVDSCISIINKQKLSTNFEKYII